jgi:hypothetical protein
MPADIVTRQIDVSTNMLATPYCPRTLVGPEFFIAGTEPILNCNVHTGALYPDTSGAANPGAVSPIAPGAAGSPQPPPRGAPQPLPQPRDTSRRFRDSGIFALPPRDSTTMRVRPRGDSLRPDSTRPRPRPDSTGRPYENFN